MFLRESNRSTALKTLSLRIRGVKTELEEAGLETEGMAETTATLQAKLKALTHGKVDILLDADTFKNTTQILREMSAAWEDMTDMEQAAALELLGGKRQANILSSLISNFETVEDVIETSMNSSGSAIAENEKYLDSIQGRLDQFSNSLQAFWNNMLNSDVIKGFVEFGTDTIKFLDTIPGKFAAIVVALGAFSKFKGFSYLNLGKEAVINIQQYSRAVTQLAALKKQGFNVGTADAWDSTAVNAYANAVSGLTAKEQAALLVKQGLNREQIEYIMRKNDVNDEIIKETLNKQHLTKTTSLLQKTTVKEVLATDMATDAKQREAIASYLAANGSKTLTRARLDEMRSLNLITEEQYAENISRITGSWKDMLANIAASPAVIMMVSTALASWINNIKTATEAFEEFKEEYRELQSAISEAEGEISSIDSELDTIQKQIDELSNKDILSLADAEQLNLLKQQTEELEHQKEIQEKILTARERQEDEKSLQAINKMLKTTAANQQANAESAAKWGQGIGIVLGALIGVAGVALAPFTGGGSLAAAGVTLGASLAGAGGVATAAAIGGGMIGSALGEKAGYAVGMNANEAGDSLIEWYESYTKAIAKAESEATAAENKYLNEITDKNYDAWQKKVEAVTTLQTEMYDGLQELQSYISNLEYTDKTADIINGYNDLMAHISVTSMDGDINAQINSIKSLQSEYYELSKGVDENGNNIALSSKEYARYQSIVAQVLGYNVGLTQTFTKNGSAIRDAQGNLVGYNTVLTETIELLQQQQREAAILAIEGEDGGNKPLLDAYKSAKKNAESVQPKVQGGRIGGTFFEGNEIEKIIGKKFAWYDNFDDYVYNNVDEIDKNLDKILQSAKSRDGKNGMDYEYYKEYLESVLEYAQSDVLRKQFKEKLFVVPQMSDSYYDLSGESLNFINEYIDAYVNDIKNIESLTDDEVGKIKDDILEFTNKIGSDTSIQEAINELMALDESSIPVGAYKQQFDKIWEEIYPDENTQELKDKNPLYKQLLPDQENIDKMMAAVKDKVDKSSRVLVQGLNQEELKVAYRLIPDIQDGITMEELKQKIKEDLPRATGPIVETYSNLVAQVESFNEIEKQTSEIVLDNTKVTQEYKDSLVELGIAEEELSDYFDINNKLVVTNAKGLNNLIKNTKNNTAQNVKLAKSQARLQYYELYKEMRNYVNAEGEVIQSKVQDIVALYEEMNALEKTIAQYSRLEVELLGAANAYEKFEQAQEMDAQTDYISSAEEMLQALGEAFNTAELGTETAQTAIAGLVPESVYKDLDTVDEKMSAIYKYFKEGKLSQYFDIQFNDDGAIESVEMKLGNLRKFIEDGLHLDANKDGIKVFEGTDWQHFEFSEKFLAGLDEAPNKLQYFADQMNVTKEVAFAFIESINDHDIEWLNGDYSSMFDSLTQSLEGDIFKTTQSISDLSAQLATGKINVEDYQKAMYELQCQEEKLADQAREQAVAWNEKSKALEEAEKKLNKYYKMLESGKDEDGNVIDAEKVKDEIEEVSDDIVSLTKDLSKLEEPTELTLQVAIDDIQKDIDKLKAELEADKVDLEKAIAINAEGKYYVTTEFAGNEKLETYANYLNEQHTLEIMMGPETPDVLTTLQNVSATLNDIKLLLETKYSLKVEADGSISKVSTFKGMWDGLKNKSLSLALSIVKKITEFVTNTSKDAKVNGTANIYGTAHARGTAHKTGNWGLPESEHDSLVGELGPELVVNPQTGKYYTVGDVGAEMVDLPKGAIIFNHKQTEGLLKNGRIASRGRAFAEGNAHVTIFANGSSKDQWKGTGYSGPNDPTYSVSDALNNINNASKSAKDSANEFAETIDWIEIRLEEINEQLDLMNAKLENAVGYSNQNQIIDSMLSINNTKLANLQAGLKTYEDYANKLLKKIPSKYRKAAQDGSIAITEFAGKADEATVEAINNYREWAEKVADLTQQIEELETEIAELAKQKFDNVSDEYDNIVGLIENANEKLDAQVSLMEDRGYIASKNYYQAMIINTQKQSAELIKERDALQSVLDEQVKLGNIKVGSDAWYEMVEQLYEVDAAIVECTSDIEEYQNAINDIYWDNFDELINRLDYLKDETQNLIDLMENSGDLVSTPEGKKYEGGTKEYWTADDVEWTDEGITSLGLYAQQMEIAEYQARQYQEAIDDLNRDYALGKYSESEYLEKLNELKSAQYDSIEAYYDAQDAIVELNEARIDTIKNGIEKEIEAYEELINKKKKELDTEKD